MKKRVFSLGLAGLTLIASYKNCGSDGPVDARQPSATDRPAFIRSDDSEEKKPKLQGTVSGDPSLVPQDGPLSTLAI